MKNKVFYGILNTMLDDYMRENSIECSVGRFLNGLGEDINSLIAVLRNVDVSSIVPNGIDTERFNQFLRRYIK